MTPMFFTIPTVLTLTRIVAIPLIVGVFYAPLDQATRNLIATVMFIVFAATDWFDGLSGAQAQSDIGIRCFSGSRCRQIPGLCIAAGAGSSATRRCVRGADHHRSEIAISALREWMAQIGASKSVAVHMIGKAKTMAQMVAIPFLLYDGVAFGVIDTGVWGQWLIWIAAVLTVWSMVYYLQKALPEIRARL
jgi:CDP-diacylglycerol--glycerol-3-phosphate 3-phosphatidyltransferase